MLIDNGEIAIYQYSTQEEKNKIKLDNWSETVLLTFFFPSAEGNTIQDKFHSHSRDTGKQWQVHCGCSWL